MPLGDGQRQLVRSPRLVLLIVKRIANVCLFGRVHRRVGATEERSCIRAVRRIDGDADARAHLEQVAIDRERLLQRVENSTGHRSHVIRVAGARQEQSELVAAEAGERLVGMEQSAQPVGDLLQQHIAEVMTKRVVDLFEAVKVHEQQRGDRLLRPRVVDGFLEPLEEKHSVRQIGQGVVGRLTAKHQELVLRLGDVAQIGDPVG